MATYTWIKRNDKVGKNDIKTKKTCNKPFRDMGEES